MTFDPHCSKLVVVLWVWDKSDLRIHWSFCNRWIKAEGRRQLNSVRLYLMCVYNEPRFAFIATRGVSGYGQRSVCWENTFTGNIENHLKFISQNAQITLLCCSNNVTKRGNTLCFIWIITRTDWWGKMCLNVLSTRTTYKQSELHEL